MKVPIPEWIPLAECLPNDGDYCIVANENEPDPMKPICKGKVRMAVFYAASVEDGDGIFRRVELPNRFVMCESFFDARPIGAFTHWWPIPKPKRQ